MKKFFFTLLFSLIFIASYAQQPPIMVCNTSGTTCTPYTNLDAAVAAASPGSYIYIPGGSFTLTTINKELHLIGAGHYPDSTHVTGITAIASNFHLDTGCSNSSFEGLYIAGISTGTNGTINNISFTRCNIPSLNLNSSVMYISTLEVPCNNCLMKDCIIGNFNPICNNCIVTGCILTNGIQNVNSSVVSNCVIYSSFINNISSGTSSTNNTVKNNVFDTADGSMTYRCTGCILTNNLTIYSSLGLSSLLETGTITSVPASNLFVNAPTVGFDYTKDFHLKSTSPGHNAGTDGTDVGIYGSSLPYPPGAVPGNPHFFFQNVTGTTDTTGNLNVQFKVRASY